MSEKKREKAVRVGGSKRTAAEITKSALAFVLFIIYMIPFFAGSDQLL